MLVIQQEHPFQILVQTAATGREQGVFRETSPGFTQSLRQLQHSLGVPGEQREVWICMAACTADNLLICVVGQCVGSCRLGGKSSDGVDCLCWTMNIYKKITFLVSAPQELWQLKPAKILVSGCSLIIPQFCFARYLS